MNFFQFLDTYPWVTVAAFAAIQLGFFFSTHIKLNELSHFFPSKKWETNGDEEHLTLIAVPEESKNAQELVSGINMHERILAGIHEVCRNVRKSHFRH